MTFAIETIGLTKRFGALVAVNDLRLEIDEGISYGLVGAPGAGKTTTIRLLTGLALPDKGAIRVFGRRLSDCNGEVGGSTAALPERLALFDYLTAREYLEVASQKLVSSRRARREQADELLRLVGFDSPDRLVVNCSFTDRKKLALAASLAHRPRLLILDNPLEGVDELTRSRWERLLTDLPPRGVTLFLTSTSLLHAERVCSKIGVLEQGRLVVETSSTL